MKNSKIKLFIMFLAGILFSSLAVFAATISIPSNFGNAVQYLNKLVVTNNNNITGVLLDGANKQIWVQKICNEDGDDCKFVEDLGPGYGSAPDMSEYFEGADGKWCVMSNDKIMCNQEAPTGGGGGGEIADYSINSIKIATGAITNPKITDSAVTSGKIANNAVTTLKIENNAITNPKIADNAVTTAKIADSNVTTAKIANNNVTTAKIADYAITTTKIETSAVKQDQVQSGYVNLKDGQTITGTKTFVNPIIIKRHHWETFIELRNPIASSSNHNYRYLYNASSNNDFTNNGDFSLGLRNGLFEDSRPLLAFKVNSGVDSSQTGLNRGSLGILDWGDENYGLVVGRDTKVKGNMKIDKGTIEISSGSNAKTAISPNIIEIGGCATYNQSNPYCSQPAGIKITKQQSNEDGYGIDILNIDEKGFSAQNNMINRAGGNIESKISGTTVHTINTLGTTITNQTTNTSNPALTVKRGQGNTGILATFEGKSAENLNIEARSDSHIIALRGKGKNLELGTTTSTGGWNDDQLFLHYSGNVGIGTNNPKAKLDVTIINTGTIAAFNASIGSLDIIGFPAKFTFNGASDKDIELRTNNKKNQLYLHRSGSVGINTANPTNYVHLVVNGAIQIGNDAHLSLCSSDRLGTIKYDSGNNNKLNVCLQIDENYVRKTLKLE